MSKLYVVVCSIRGVDQNYDVLNEAPIMAIGIRKNDSTVSFKDLVLPLAEYIRPVLDDLTKNSSITTTSGVPCDFEEFTSFIDDDYVPGPDDMRSLFLFRRILPYQTVRGRYVEYKFSLLPISTFRWADLDAMPEYLLLYRSVLMGELVFPLAEYVSPVLDDLTKNSSITTMPRVPCYFEEFTSFIDDDYVPGPDDRRSLFLFRHVLPYQTVGGMVRAEDIADNEIYNLIDVRRRELNETTGSIAASAPCHGLKKMDAYHTVRGSAIVVNDEFHVYVLSARPEIKRGENGAHNKHVNHPTEMQ